MNPSHDYLLTWFNLVPMTCVGARETAGSQSCSNNLPQTPGCIGTKALVAEPKLLKLDQTTINHTPAMPKIVPS